jgi:preprotein translocase subunit SecB
MKADLLALGEYYFDVRAKLEVTVTGRKTKAHLVEIVASFDVHFHSEELPKQLVERFCNSEARLIVWPYFREYVSDVSSRMYIPPVILPLSNDQEG